MVRKHLGEDIFVSIIGRPIGIVQTSRDTALTSEMGRYRSLPFSAQPERQARDLALAYGVIGNQSQ
jgi:hypothetical protein